MTDIKWSRERRRLDSLIPNPYNPREISKKKFEELKKSIQKFGFCEFLVIQPDGKLIAGHQRYRALLSLGYEEVHVSVPSRYLNEDEEKSLCISLNKIQGTFDDNLLFNSWPVDILLDSGFSMEELCTEEKEEKKNASFSINIKFESEEDLHFAEKELQDLMTLLPSAKMKVKVK